VGTAAYGMLWLGEDRSVARMACFGLILMGIVGLKLLTLRSDTGS
jgi:quaternary ammonium compound-resistance protein SugE